MNERRRAGIDARRFALARPADGEHKTGADPALLHAQPQRRVLDGLRVSQIDDQERLAVAMRVRWPR